MFVLSGRFRHVLLYIYVMCWFTHSILWFILQTEECTRLVVIDEIGKMELFSRGFQQTVKELLKHPKVTMFATIPAPGKANPYVEEIRHRDDVLVYTVGLFI